MLRKLEKYINSRTTFDMFLKSLNTALRGDRWESGNGWIQVVSDKRYAELKNMINVMTIEELRDPQMISNDRIIELADISNIDVNDIKSLFFHFEISHRIELPNELESKIAFINKLEKERGIRRYRI